MMLPPCRPGCFAVVVDQTDQMTDKPSPKAAARILAERDPVIARLVAAAGPPHLAPPAERTSASWSAPLLPAAGRAAARPSTAGWWRARRRLTPEPLLALPPRSCAPRGCPGTRRRRCGTSPPRFSTARGAVDREGWPQRRRDRRAADHGAGHRALDRRDVPDVPAAPPRRVAGRRPRRPPGVRAAWQSRADRQGARAARRPYRPYRRVVAWYCWRAADYMRERPTAR